MPIQADVWASMSPRRDDITQSDLDRGDQPRIAAEPIVRYSHSLEVALAMLECFRGDRTALGIFELADLLNVSRSTAHRYAQTHVELGNLEQDRKRRYCLAGRAADPGTKLIETINRALKARAVLEGLRNDTGHTVSLGVLHDARAVFVERLHGHKRGQYQADHDLRVGANVPLYCTALGKALLTGLTDNQRNELLEHLKLTRHGPNTITGKKRFIEAIEQADPHHAVVSDEELFSGSRSIAALVPRALRYGYTVAIDVTVPSTAFTIEQLVRQIGPLVEAAAGSIVH
jgi:IclR family pca regulon transcriptional regulator